MPSIRRIEWTAEQKKQFIEYVNKGYSERKMAKIFGVNRSTIHKFKELWRLKTPGYTPTINQAEATDPQDELINQITHQLKFYKQRTKHLQKIVNDRDWLIDSMKDSLSVLKSPPKYEIPLSDKGASEQEVVALFSDFQAFEKIERDETNAFEYNFDIFTQRFHYYLDRIVRITNLHRKSFPINKLHVFGLGDYLEGEDIYFGQSARIESNIIKQFFDTTDLMARGFSELSRHYDTIYVTWLTGNHGRVFKKGQEKWYVNWEYVMGRYLQMMLRDHKNIILDVPMSWWTIKEVLNWKFYLTHGDELIRYMGVPWYSFERMDNRTAKLMQALGEMYHYMIIGHHHEALEWDAAVGERICNGSFNMGNPLALKKLKLMTRPTQKIFGVHKDHGISFRYNVRLDDEERDE